MIVALPLIVIGWTMVGGVLVGAVDPTSAAGEINEERPLPLSSVLGSRVSPTMRTWCPSRRFRVAERLGEEGRRVHAERPNIALLQGMLETSRHENEEGCLPVRVFLHRAYVIASSRSGKGLRFGNRGFQGKHERFGN